MRSNYSLICINNLSLHVKSEINILLKKTYKVL